MKVPKTVFIASSNLKAGDIVKGKRIMAQPLIHFGLVHYFTLNREKQVEHKTMVADKEITVRRPRYNHVVFAPPKMVVQQNHPAHDASEPAGHTPTVDKIMKQLADFF